MRSPLGRRTAVLAVLLVGLCACGGSSTPRSASTPLRLPTVEASAPRTTPSGSLPREAPAVQGSAYYAVFLAVARVARDDQLVTAQERAKALGYEGGVGDIGCTPGARQQLHLKAVGDYTAFSVLFATRAQAQQLAAAYGSGVVGIARVTVACLD